MKNKTLYKMHHDFLVYKRKYKSLSKRIRALRQKIDNVISSHQYYIRQRFPAVKERQKLQQSTLKQYKRSQKLLKGFHFISNRNKKQRYLVHLTYAEYLKLKKLLSGRHKTIKIIQM